MIRRTHWGMRWMVLPEFDPLFAAVLASNGEVVKKTSVTTVTRHETGGRVFYVKRYRHAAKLLAPTKHLFRLANSQREWKLAPRLQHLGVRVVPHLAHGERWNWRGLLESALLTEGTAGFSPLKGRADLDAPALQQALGAFMRRMHDAGVLYLDLAPQNVLYSPATGELCLIDVNRVSVRRRQSLQARVDHLVLLQARMPLTAAFYEGYGKEFAARAGEIGRQAQLKREWVMRRLSGHWDKHTHQLIEKRSGGLRWRVRRAHDDPKLATVLEDPERFCGHAAEGFFVQRFGFARARRAFREAYNRELMGKGGPRPVAVGEQRVLGICLRSYFVSTA
jgi:tRNA A-37 threonylcarbamoyl transferase component Bud32